MLGLRTTIYHVTHLDEAKAWYEKAFQQAPYFDEPFYVGFNIRGYELGLMPINSSDEKKVPGVVAYWGVDDIQYEYDRLINCGAFANEAPHNVGGSIEVATVFDLWGNLIGLIYNPEFKVE